MAGELRITGGALSRRRIAVPAAADRGRLRPTSDKVRAAMMNALGPALDGARVLDVFAGSGALGIEGLSRGARAATFIEKDRKSAKVIEENLADLGIAGRGRVLVDDAARALGRLEDACFDVIFADPPYRTSLAELLPELARLLAPGGVLVLERDRRAVDPPPPAVTAIRDRLYGDTRVLMYARAAAPAAPANEQEPSPEPSERHETHMPTAAIYPGSFDPMTNGHVDIVQRGLRTFDRVILAVANNVQKNPLFSVEERVRLARECLGHLPGFEVDSFDGLVVEYARKTGVHVLLRGLRAVSDFEYEFQLASMNRKLNREVDTVFMMTSEESFYLSSRLIREVASFGGDIEGMVPEPVLRELKKKYPAGPAPKRAR
jgi:pantetheine-phosphate adenylyltransferase